MSNLNSAPGQAEEYDPSGMTETERKNKKFGDMLQAIGTEKIGKAQRVIGLEAYFKLVDEKKEANDLAGLKKAIESYN